MASQEGCVTFNWEIRNYSLFLKAKMNQFLESPTWELEDTKGRVRKSYLLVGSCDSAIVFFLWGFRVHRLRTEMFFMSSNGEVLLNTPCTGFHLPKSALLDKNRQSILLNDTLSLRCKTWEKTLKTSECHIATVLRSLNHLWTIENLASSDYHDTYFEQENAKHNVSLEKDEDDVGMFIVELEPHALDDKYINCTFSVKDSCGRVLDHKIIYFDSSKYLISFVIDSNITSITLQLELIVALHERPELSESSQVVRETQLAPNSPTNSALHELSESSQVVRETPLEPKSPTNIALHELSAFSQVVRETPLEPNSPTNIALHELLAFSQVVRETPLEPNSPTNSAKHKNVSGTLSDDFLLLYRDRALSDATLNIEGKSFSAHRAVLAARSPVFRDMFEKDETSDGQSGVVDIDDLDNDTVDRMLVYLYADSVGDLPWKEASALYYAADKYEILPLKEKCADFLRDSLAVDNACDVLVLADKHSDRELMTRVVNFILGHEEVVSSAQWEELEDGYPRLCAKITKELFLERGKK